MEFMYHYLEDRRVQLGVSNRQLSYGLCYHSHYAEIELGNVYADKLLLDAILQRLGVSEHQFEHYITQEEYHLQVLREDIWVAIEEKAYETAQSLLLDYEEQLKKPTALQKQYIQYMKLHMAEQREDLGLDWVEEYLHLIQLSIPNFHVKNLKKYLYTEAEFYFLIQYGKLRGIEAPTEELGIYQQLLAYLEKRQVEDSIKAKYMPYLVFLLYEKFQDQLDQSYLLEQCDQAIEYARTVNNYTYLALLFEQKLGMIEGKPEYEGEVKKLRKYLKVLCKVYADYQVPMADGKEFQPRLYLWKNYYRIPDVIYKRRKMLGMQQKDLIQGKSDEKLISRMENGVVRSTPKKVSFALERLHLTGELNGGEVQCSRKATYLLCKELTELVVFSRYEEAKRKLEEVKKSLDRNLLVNQQYVLHKEAVIDRALNLMTEEEALEKLIEALELTVGRKPLWEREHFHFSKREIILLNNILLRFTTLKREAEWKQWAQVLERYYQNADFRKAHKGIYLYTVLTLLNCYGDFEQYEKSNMWIEIYMKETLESEVHREINRCIFAKVWNLKQRGMEENEKAYKNLLEESYILSEIKRDEVVKSYIQVELDYSN